MARRWALGAIGLATAGVGPLAAQQEEPDSAVEIAPVMVRVLRSTIGTGGPYSVSVAAGPELTRGSAGAFLEEALRAVPGVQIQNRFNFAVGERLSIRGFGPRAQFGIRGIRVLVDGIPATLPDGQATLDHLDLAGLGRVEALRGPNATLYGNAAGGVLHFRTLDPALQGTSLEMQAASGSHGLLTLQGTATGTVGAGGYRVGVSRLAYDGFRRDPVADSGGTYGAATRSVFNGTATFPLTGGTLRVVANGVDLDADNPGSLSRELLAEGDRQAYANNVLGHTRKAVLQGQVGATWQGPLAGVDAELALWGVRRELENPIPGTVIGVDRNAGGFRALFRDAGAAGIDGLSLGAGFEVELQHDDRLNWDSEGGEPGALTVSQLEQVRGAGLFLQARLDIDAGVSVLGGLRYDRIRFSVNDRFIEAGDPDDSGVRSMGALSPSIGLLVRAGGGLELFGSVARSFETPTTTELANRPTGSGGFNPDLQPQTGVSVEGGVRGRLGDDWHVEATLFRTTLRDGLVPYEVPFDPGRQYFRNSGRSHHTGWEVSVDGSPAPGASIRLAYTRVDARFDAFETGEADYAGNRVPGLAPYRLDVLSELERGPAFVELRALYQDEVPVDDAGQAAAPAYFLLDARTGLQDVEMGAFRLSPYLAVANLLNRRYVASVAVNAFGSRYFEPGPGRTYRVGMGVAWRR